jgi:hypothetical protein
MSFNANQNGSSSEMLVRCPCIVSDLFCMTACLVLSSLA